MSATASMTSTTHGAREHARSQDGTAVDAQPVLPASACPSPPAGVESGTTALGRTRRGRQLHPQAARARHGAPPHRRHRRRLRRTCCSTTPAEPWERLNVADTVKVQWQVYLGAGHLLLSDQGRVLASRRRRHLGPARRALRHVHARAQRRSATATAPRSGPSPAGRELLRARRGQARPRAARHPAVRLVLPGRAGRRRRQPRVPRLGRRRRIADAARRDAADRADRQHRAPARPAPRVHVRARWRSLAWRAEPTARRRPALGRHRPRAAAPSSTPQDYLDREGDRMTAAHDFGRELRRELVAPRGPWSAVRPARPGPHHRRPRRQPGRRLPRLRRARHRRPLQRARRPCRAGLRLPRRPAACCVTHEDRPLMTVVADRRRPPRHARRRVLQGVQHAALRPPHLRPARLRGELPRRGRPKYGLGKRDLVSNINWFMNVPVEPDGALGIVDGISAPGLSVAPARRARRPRGGLQLPADQQPVQRLRPDAASEMVVYAGTDAA